MTIGGILFYLFHRWTSRICASADMEGLQGHDTSSRWGLVAVTFFLTVIYLPLSTMAVHVLVWSDDLWVVPNPYTNATVFPPILPPLRPTGEFRDPLDFCWTTTMKLNEVNYSPAIIIVAMFTFATVSYEQRDYTISLTHPLVDRLVSYPLTSNYHSSHTYSWSFHGTGKTSQ